MRRIQLLCDALKLGLLLSDALILLLQDSLVIEHVHVAMQVGHLTVRTALRLQYTACVQSAVKRHRALPFLVRLRNVLLQSRRVVAGYDFGRHGTAHVARCLQRKSLGFRHLQLSFLT